MHAPDGKRDVETPKWSVASSRVGIVENAAPALTNPQESGVHELARARCKLPLAPIRAAHNGSGQASPQR
jgi:hypothetical protein